MVGRSAWGEDASRGGAHVDDGEQEPRGRLAKSVR